MSAEFTTNNKVHNKVHLATKILPFIAEYRGDLRIGIDIRRKEKIEKATEFAERMKKIQEVEAALIKV